MDRDLKYYPHLDSLRAFACLFVIVFHSNTVAFLRDKYHFNLFQGGYIGVDLFFTLSGFLITGILIDQFITADKVDVLTFYKKRLLRLYPPLIVATLVFLVPLLFWDHVAALSNLFFILTYTGDCVILFRKIFPVLQYPSMFSHCWSLAVEEQFYLVFPSLFMIIMKYARKHNRDHIIGTFIFYNLVFIILIIALPILLKSYFYKFFLWRFFQIFFGGYLAFIYSKRYQKNFVPSKITANTINWIYRIYENSFVSAIALLLFFSIFILNINLTPFNIPIHYYLLTVLGSIIIINAYKGEHILYRVLLSNQKLRYLGKISYGLYLFHFPIFYLKRLNIFNGPTTLTSTIILDIVSILATLTLAILSYELVEKRFLHYKRKLEHSNKINSSASLQVFNEVI
jgi:peptidoglycan/LPS O-acetylase OafA/YrhL